MLSGRPPNCRWRTPKGAADGKPRSVGSATSAAQFLSTTKPPTSDKRSQQWLYSGCRDAATGRPTGVIRGGGCVTGDGQPNGKCASTSPLWRGDYPAGVGPDGGDIMSRADRPAGLEGN